MSCTGGDWLCAACQHLNFKKREACQRFQYPKYGGPDVATYLFNRTGVLAGDWYCTAVNCGTHNYASRVSCYRCSAPKSEYVTGYPGSIYGPESSAPPGWKPGDWICASVGCGMHNYASRTECFRCRKPRGFGSAVYQTNNGIK